MQAIPNRNTNEYPITLKTTLSEDILIPVFCLGDFPIFSCVIIPAPPDSLFRLSQFFQLCFPAQLLRLPDSFFDSAEAFLSSVFYRLSAITVWFRLSPLFNPVFHGLPDTAFGFRICPYGIRISAKDKPTGPVSEQRILRIIFPDHPVGGQNGEETED